MEPLAELLSRCRVVLVRPTIAANIGATARIMRNMGVRDLVLVSPEADPADRNARQLSTHGEAILDQARIVSEFGEAVADCQLVVGTTARTGGPYRVQSLGTPDEIMPHVVDAMHDGPIALVFGPEPSGLTNAEMTRCHYGLHIPADAEYPALNLAQAVAICLYDLRRHLMATEEMRPTNHASAPFAAQERMFASLREAFETVHFLYGDNAQSLMHAVRHLIGRARPTAMEIDVLFGLARQLRWFARKNSADPSVLEK